MQHSLDSLADQVNAWCAKRRVTPANGQVGTATTVRTLRYYRTVNLLDAPTAGGGEGYGRRHLLQACAVRVLQAEGLPLSRIQSLLFGRSDDELKTVLDSVKTGAHQLPASAPMTQPETWQTWPITPEMMIVSRRPGQQLTAAQLAAIAKIIGG